MLLFSKFSNRLSAQFDRVSGVIFLVVRDRLRARTLSLAIGRKGCRLFHFSIFFVFQRFYSSNGRRKKKAVTRYRHTTTEGGGFAIVLCMDAAECQLTAYRISLSWISLLFFLYLAVSMEFSSGKVIDNRKRKTTTTTTDKRALTKPSFILSSNRVQG